MRSCRTCRGSQNSGHRHVAVIWREIENWTKEDLERDRSFVAEKKLTEGADDT